MGKAMYQHRENPMGLKCHWHSHPNMSVNPSSTDRELYRSLGGESWIVGLIFNEKGDVSAHLSTYVDVEGARTEYFTALDVTIMENYNAKDIEAWDKEYDDNVVAKTYAPASPMYGRKVGGIHDYSGQFPLWEGDEIAGYYYPEFEKVGHGHVIRSNPKTTLQKLFLKELAEYNQDNQDAIDNDKTGTIKPIEWNTNGDGWCYISETRLYNPMRDKEIRGVAKILEQITEYHDEWEMFMVAYYDKEFKGFCLKHIEEIRDANLLNAAIGFNTDATA